MNNPDHIAIAVTFLRFMCPCILPQDRAQGLGIVGFLFESGMNNQDYISESLETIFWSKYLNSLMRTWDVKNPDPEWKNSDPALLYFQQIHEI
jgi:hypothetical protein